MHRVLILSGKPLLREKDERDLASDNIQVTASSSFDGALFKNFYKQFDIVVISDDLRITDTDELCRNFRCSTRAFIIMLGRRSEAEMLRQQEDIGFDRYYNGNIRPPELATRLRIILAKRSAWSSPEVYQGEKVVTRKNRSGEADSPDGPGESGPDSDPIDLWRDPNLGKLVSELMGGSIIQLKPEINLQVTDGFVYPLADAILETTGRETLRALESLAGAGILIKEYYETILASPTGFVQLVPVRRCPSCDSPDLSRGKLIEHFFCGHVGPEEDFNTSGKHICPKCRKDLKLIGTDYRIPGLRYTCRSCHEVFPTPTVKYRCLKTGQAYGLEELNAISLCSYRLNEASRKRLEFELEPKKLLVDYLHALGYEVREAVQIEGRSGATHTIDLLATLDDPIAEHTVGIGILTSSPGEGEVDIDALFGFDSKIYDIGIDHRIVIAVPSLARDALRFADRQGIRVYSLDELRKLLARGPEAAIAGAGNDTGGAAGPETLDHRAWIRWLLERKGYEVTENAVLKGRSGADHVLEFYAERDDGIANHKLAACIITNTGPDGDESAAGETDINRVVQFDSAAYDAGIADKVIVAVPGLSTAARQFAEYQRIQVIESSELAGLSASYAPAQA